MSFGRFSFKLTMVTSSIFEILRTNMLTRTTAAPSNIANKIHQLIYLSRNCSCFFMQRITDSFIIHEHHIYIYLYIIILTKWMIQVFYQMSDHFKMSNWKGNITLWRVQTCKILSFWIQIYLILEYILLLMFKHFFANPDAIQDYFYQR